MAHLGYLDLSRASLRCCNSSFRSSGEVHTTLALWVSVPMTLYLADRLMMTIPFKYWSVWMDFVINFYAKVVVCLWFDQGIKKRDSPIFLIIYDSELYSRINTVNMIQKKFFMGLLFDDPYVIHKPILKPREVGGRPEHFSLKMLHVQVSYCRAYWWPHSHPFHLFIEPNLKREVSIMQTEP